METEAMNARHAEAIETILGTGNDMSDFEMAVAAAQARSSIGRIRDFIKFHPPEEQALKTAMDILATVIPDHIRAR